MKARSFMYGSVGVLALAVAFNLGAVHADAQDAGTARCIGIAVAGDGSVGRRTFVAFENGDVYWSDGQEETSPWYSLGNPTVPGVPAREGSWSQIKGDHRSR